MGGYGSGRPRLHGQIEQRLRLDVRMFRQRGWLVPGHTGTLHWSQHGEQIASIRYQVRNTTVVLSYQTRDGDDQPLPVEITVLLESIPCRYGGRRYYWLCPRCARRREVLMLGWGGRGWACRRCLQLRYACQGLRPADRVQRRASKMFERLGGDYELTVKPKWMRWRTFHRKVAKAQEMDARADMMFAARCMSRFGMIPDELADFALKL